MRSENSPDGQKRRSVIEDVRRAQIIDSAVEVFADVGYQQASLARIAQRAGISKGVISYHFAGKEDLMASLVDYVYASITGHVAPQVLSESTAQGRIAIRIRAVAEYARQHPSQLRALSEVLDNLRDDDGKIRYGHRFNEPLYEGLEAEFEAGQAAGELRTFDGRVMAVTIQAAIDAMIDYWNSYPDYAIEDYADNLVDVFAAAISVDTHAGLK